MSNIYKNDSGTVLAFEIKDGVGVVDIRGTTVSLIIKKGETKLNKTATVTDGINGKCEFLLTSEDVDTEGIYFFQATVTFQNGNKFSSDVQKFTVASLI